MILTIAATSIILAAAVLTTGLKFPTVLATAVFLTGIFTAIKLTTVVASTILTTMAITTIALMVWTGGGAQR